MKPVFRKLENNVALIDIQAPTREKQTAFRKLRAEGYKVFTVPSYEHSLNVNLNSLAAQTICSIYYMKRNNNAKNNRELFTWYCMYLPLAKYLNDVDEPRITKEYKEARR